jgi:hypothetical protein
MIYIQYGPIVIYIALAQLRGLGCWWTHRGGLLETSSRWGLMQSACLTCKSNIREWRLYLALSCVAAAMDCPATVIRPYCVVPLSWYCPFLWFHTSVGPLELGVRGYCVLAPVLKSNCDFIFTFFHFAFFTLAVWKRSFILPLLHE